MSSYQYHRLSEKNKTEESSSRHQYGLCSLLFFSWLSPLVKLGNERPLEEEDLVSFPGQRSTKDLTERIGKLWSAEIRRSNAPRLWLVILRSLPKHDIAFLVLTHLMYMCCRYLKPVFLFLMLSVLGHDTESYLAFVFATGLSITLGWETFFMNHFKLRSILVATHIRNALTGLIYNKVLVTKENGIAEVTSGHVINLVSKDMEPFTNAAFYFIYVPMAPLELAAISSLLSYFVGFGSLASMFVGLASLVMQLATGRKFRNLRRKIATLTDHRLRRITDVISGIRVVKMNAWETCLERKIGETRRKEIASTRWKTILFCTILSFGSIFSAVTTFVALVTMVLMGHHLKAQEVFTTYLLMTASRSALTTNFVEAVFSCSQSLTSLRRIQHFLLIDVETNDSKRAQIEVRDDEKIEKTSKQLAIPSKMVVKERKLTIDIFAGKKETPSLSFVNVTCFHNSTPLLENASFDTCGSQLISVTGPVGSGKTAIFNAIIGELSGIEGEIRVKGRLAYVPQEAWMFSGSIRENIVFGEEFDEERYFQIIEACGLKKDLELFIDGDLTLVGERGITLSGGQRSRVSLARAVYSNADIYLLDDPLRALDANVSAHVFDKCICGLLSRQLRLLVTHKVDHLAKSDRILVMKDGRAVTKGSYIELLATDGYIAYLASLAQERNGKDTARKAAEEFQAQKGFSHQEQPNLEDYVGLNTAQEDRDVGAVSFRTYWTFLRVGASILFLLLALSLFVLAEGSLVASNVWLSRWSKMTLELQRNPTTLAIYASIIAAALLLAFIRTLLFNLLVLRSSERLHNKMLKSVLRAPVSFFDTTPTGRILNRFSRDTGCMDDALTVDMYLSIQLVLTIVAGVLLVSGTVFYVSIAAAPVLLLLAYYLRRGWKVARELKRIEAIATSPLYSHFADTMEGVVTIRCHNKEKSFVDVLYKHTDNNARAFLSFWGCNRWISLRFDLISASFATAVTFTAILMGLDEALTGLAVTYAVQTSALVCWAINRLTATDYWMTSVQRVLRYAELEPEPGYELTREPPAEWPKDGTLQFKETSLRYYNQGPRVLNKLCFTVKSGEKVGIVGRSGAGKSSLIAALMRMPEHEGDIFIDGATIKELNLTQSRSVVSVIPQNPFLFADTIRFNLDPEEKHSDLQLWHVLEKMQLKPLIEKSPNQLHCLVHENGSNFSLGERQMICLARAMLQKNKILIFDEATASIDLKTEKLIHEAVHTKFDNCTVLTIAHRLDTITDHDRVLVLDEGKVVEFDQPKVLLTINDGYFAKLHESYTTNQ